MALVADITGVRSIVIGTYFANRSRLATRSIMGVFTNLVPLVFPVDFDATFCRWLETVRNRLFETEGLADVPYENLCQQLRADGVEPPEVQIIFAKSSIHAGQRFANLSVSYRPALTQTMPWGVHDLH